MLASNRSNAQEVAKEQTVLRQTSHFPKITGETSPKQYSTDWHMVFESLLSFILKHVLCLRIKHFT